VYPRVLIKLIMASVLEAGDNIGLIGWCCLRLVRLGEAQARETEDGLELKARYCVGFRGWNWRRF
jgi:hypothetical protein